MVVTAACPVPCTPRSITASGRLFRLMRTNSAVLKAHSAWHEWFYRALQPGVHYLEFFNSSRGGRVCMRHRVGG